MNEGAARGGGGDPNMNRAAHDYADARPQHAAENIIAPFDAARAKNMG